MSRPMILAFNVSPDRLSRLRLVCMRTGTLLRAVESTETAQPIGVLCGVMPPTAPTVPAPDFDGEMLLFANMSNAQVQKFLQTSRQMKAPTFPLKAVLTPTNAAWTAGKLHAELTAEHAAIQGQQEPVHQG